MCVCLAFVCVFVGSGVKRKDVTGNFRSLLKFVEI